MKKYAAEQKYQWNYVVDNNHQVADAFGANRTPESFLFDKSLTLIYHGAIDDNPSDADAVTRRHLKEAINEMLAGKRDQHKRKPQCRMHDQEIENTDVIIKKPG